MSESKLSNFVHAFGAARLLLQRANKEGFLIEGLALYSSLTDAFLRIGLVLKRQLLNKNNTVDDLLISQEQSGKFYTERQIQKFALSEQVIDEPLYKEIEDLYSFRNDVIHKFFLTDLRYGQLPPILERYEMVYKQLYKLIWALEREQINLGVGMTGLGAKSDEKLMNEILKKVEEP
jgi:hypothetical protein